VRTVGCFTDGHGRAAPAACSGLTRAAEPGVYRLCPSRRIEEISYNFAITGNYIAGNNIIDGLAGNQFPGAAIYISESGSDRQFGGVPACAEPSCAGRPSHSSQSVISGNTLVDNGGSVFLWQNSDRYCSGPNDGVCTLVNGGRLGTFHQVGVPGQSARRLGQHDHLPRQQ
jgi:hypothetical protein